MDKSLAGLIGAVSALAIAAPAAATSAQPPSMAAAMEVHSYSDLLKPIPNSAELLKTAAEVPAATPAEAGYQKAQFYLWFGPRRGRYYHHHHHHHHYYYHHHHHHHHHHDE